MHAKLHLVLSFDQLKLEKEIQQFTDQSIAITEKLANDDVKIKAQQMQKETALRSLNGVTESRAKAEQECEALEQKYGDLQKQLGNWEAELEDLSKYPGQMRAQRKIKDELEEEVAALKAELQKLKPEPQPITPKVCANLWSSKVRIQHLIEIFLVCFLFVIEIVPVQKKCIAETQR